MPDTIPAKAVKALVVGISDYGSSVNGLPGCRRDILDWRNLLTGRFGVPASRIRSRIDAQATRAGVVRDLHWLFSKAKAGDHLIFAYAGHGTRVKRRGKLTDALFFHPI